MFDTEQIKETEKNVVESVTLRCTNNDWKLSYLPALVVQIMDHILQKRCEIIFEIPVLNSTAEALLPNPG